MRKPEDIIAQLDKELNFDMTNIDSVITRLPLLYNELLMEWYSASKAIDKLDIQMSDMYAELYGYYRISYEVDLNTAEIKAMIENNVDRNKIKLKLSQARTFASFIEKCMNQITDTRWGIKGLQEYENFRQGVR